MTFLRLIILSTITLINFAHAADKIPSKKDGYRETAVFNGNQNMPVTLYGSAVDWSLACLKGKTDQCMRLALALEEGRGDLEPEIRAALGYYVSACEKGNGAGCARASMIMREGTANFTNADLAQQTATRGCDILDDQDSCVVKALGLPDDQHTMTDNIIDQACQNGSDYGCELKAKSLFNTPSNDASQKSAVTLFKDACDDEQAWGCAGFSQALNSGIGVELNYKKAVKIAKKGCLEASGNTVSSCSLYGRYLTKSDSLDDFDLGVKLLTKACLAKDAAACNEAGMLGRTKPASSGIADWEVPLFYRDGCDLDNGMACFGLAKLYLEGYGQLKEYQNTPIKLLDKACNLGSSDACDHVKSLGEPRERILRKRPPKIDISLTAEQQLALILDFEEQRKYGIVKNALVRLAYEGVADAAWVLGGWLYYGHSGMFNAPNKTSGFNSIENAARQGHVEAAKWVSMAYWYGDGVAIDRQKGQGYMAIAASRGDNMARDIYRSMLAEPIREAYARNQKEMEEDAERRKTDWGYQMSLANTRWSQAMRGTSSGGAANQQRANAAWQRSQSALDKLNWNNAVGYSTGRTNACPMSNPYC